MLVKNLALKILDVLDNEKVEITDYCNCLNYTYVLTRIRNKEYLGIAYTPTEDLRASEIGRKPSTEELPDLVTDLDSLVRALGIALINAISHYLVDRNKLRLPRLDLREYVLDIAKPGCTACFVGSITPVANAVSGKCTVYQLERKNELRGNNYPDIDAPLIIPRCDIIVITGASLVNNTIDYLLTLKGINARVMLSGPTASAYPPVLHELGIDVVGGSLIIDPQHAMEILKLGGGYRALDRSGLLYKYVHSRDDAHG